MTPDHVPGTPHLVRPVLQAMVAWSVALLLAALAVPAPLERTADPAHAPNPAKAAWFLVWVQELVSHGTWWMVPLLGVAAAFTVLPWLRPAPFERAAWFRPGERLLAAAAGALALAVLVLTVVGLFLRGEQWRLIAPF